MFLRPQEISRELTRLVASFRARSPPTLTDNVMHVLRHVCTVEDEVRQEEQMKILMSPHSQLDRSKLIEVTVDAAPELRQLANSTVCIGA